MSTLKVDLPQQLPIAHTADVLVIGGGPGGMASAIAAARKGADTLLVEHYGFLGGMATAGEVNPFMGNQFEGKSLDTGIFEEWLDRIAHYGGQWNNSRVFDPNCARLAAEDLCVDAGVRLLYHHRVAHVETEGRRISGVVLHSKSGLTAAKAKQYIDSTGDGDLAAMAGCNFEYGDEETHSAQPMTLCFKLKLDHASVPEEMREDPYQYMKDCKPQIQEVYLKAKEQGRIDCPRENVLVFRGVDNDVVHFNTTRVVLHKSIDGQELSNAEVVARKQLRQIMQVLREDVPVFKNCRLYSIAPQIGIRESRRIVGRAYVNMQDYSEGRTWPDAIARVTYPVDIHNPQGTGTTIVRLPAGSWYEIPFGCLLPKDIDNLGIGSRCISVDHGVHSSVRVMPPVCSLGQAIGTAAGMAVKEGKDISEIDGLVLKEDLIKQGRNLVEYDPNRPKPVVDEETRAKLDKLAARRAESYSA